MKAKFIFDASPGKYKVPVSDSLYMKNYEYFSGMGVYSDEVCKEKALLTTGYKLVKPTEEDFGW